MSNRKRPAWTAPAGLKVEVTVARGDVTLTAHAAVGDAPHVARLLVAMARKIGIDAPDTLPHADTVPGVVLPIDPTEIYDAEGRKPRRLGFG